MNKIIMILILLCPITLVAYDDFTGSFENLHWETEEYLYEDIKIKSIRKMTNRKLKAFKNAYSRINYYFDEFMQIDTSGCSEKLEIRIIPHYAIGSNKYFPYEIAYSDEKGPVTGRYFRGSSIIYLTSDNSIFSWKSIFAHELAHHFFNACGIEFYSDHLEHMVINKFEKRYNE